MEEILASIRRIIEDSDSARRPDDVVDDTGVETEAFEAEAPEVILADDDQHERSAEVEAFRSEFSAPAEEAHPEPARVVDTVQPVLQALDGGRAHERAPERVPAAAAERGEPARSNGANGAENGARGAIISEIAGRQVAAAFEELNDAFTASRRRSYDEIAEEIMRPMLQEWLDNNLPLLVERLVREEIERVARGGTR